MNKVADVPPLSVAVSVLDTLLRGRVLVAHAAWIEQAFLSRAFTAHGAALRCPVIDTAAFGKPCFTSVIQIPGISVDLFFDIVDDDLTFCVCERYFFDRERKKYGKDLQSTD